jgi:hypothetical protein
MSNHCKEIFSELILNSGEKMEGEPDSQLAMKPYLGTFERVQED